jgi:DNA-directed RNA polymerase specialized sigma24 family protein
MTRDSQELLISRINILIGLTLCQVQKRTAPAEVIEMLDRLGVQQQEIADLLGLGKSGVSMALHRARKNGAQLGRKKTKKK